MALDIAAAVALIGAALEDIAGLRVYEFPADKVAAPAAVIVLEAVDYDAATMRSADRAIFRILVVAGTVSDRAGTDRIYEYLGTGPRSVKTAVDAIGGHAVRVTEGRPDVFTIGDVTYRSAATFTVDYIS